MINNRKLNLILTTVTLLTISHQATATPSWVTGSNLYDGADSSNNLTADGAYPSSSNTFGTIVDGGHDGFGYITFNANQLEVTRDVDVLQNLNTYRWIDTFVNNTGSQLDTTVTFWGNLSSDGSTVVDQADQYSTISHQSTITSTWDPVFGFVWGNNAWTDANISMWRSGDYVYAESILSLDIGESVSIAHFATLQRPEDDPSYYVDNSGRIWGGSLYDATPYVASTQTWADGIITNPLFDGIDTSNIANFAVVPEPTTLAILALGLTSMGIGRRRKLK